MKRLIIQIDENGEPRITIEGALTSMEMFGIAGMLNHRATAQENAKIAERLFSNEEGEKELAMAESLGRPGSRFTY